MLTFSRKIIPQGPKSKNNWETCLKLKQELSNLQFAFEAEIMNQCAAYRCSVIHRHPFIWKTLKRSKFKTLHGNIL